ncbi:MAG: hypothetical protein M1829_005212 [Trizodia sp. TS-e1964]|nr:MAG: hypothetical protein M1829_005212 [Trizodia sp. TS-e1964]
MYKWHIHPIGRVRHDIPFTKVVADGIATSIRQFHIPSSSQQDISPVPQRKPSPPKPLFSFKRRRQTDSERQEIQSLGRSPLSQQPAFGGIDARSLAAPAPSKGFTISRLSSDMAPSSQDRLPSRHPAQPGYRPLQTGPTRRGTSPRGGRGDRGGLGSREGDGQSQGRGRRKRSDREPLQADTFEYTPGEMEYLEAKAAAEEAVESTYTPAEITREGLIDTSPALPIGDWGAQATIGNIASQLSRRPVGEWCSIANLAQRVLSGAFVRFETEAEREEVLAFANKIVFDKAKAAGEIAKELEFEVVGPEIQEGVLKRFIGGIDGVMDTLKAGVEKGGAIGNVLRITSKNGTYLPVDGSSLLGKVQRLMPAAAPASFAAPRKAAPAPAARQMATSPAPVQQRSQLWGMLDV